jgi:hypothetical protein
MSFEHVYRVTTLNPLVSPGSIDALQRDVPVPLPPGYREYLTSLGDGELCDLLRVRPPKLIRKYLRKELWEREGQVRGLRDGWWKPCAITPEDLESAVTFADSAEGDQFVVCPRFVPRLFELPRHSDTVREHKNGFWGVVDYCVKEMEHEFAFFEPFDDKRRRHWNFDVDVAVGFQGIVDGLLARWGCDSLKLSRTWPGDNHPNLFVRPIHARFVLYFEEYRLKENYFSVVMDYDAGAQSEATAFVESFAIPGRSWAH